MVRKIGGLLALIISFIVYWLTLEPTTSMWDCSEFIACAAGLQVGHAPGAPVFMLLGRFFSLFAFDNSQIAYMVNLLSATASAFSIFFLFHTIYWFGEKMLQKTKQNPTLSFNINILTGAAFLGAMTFAFTDTFWFSAVEGEVYATSSLFTALVFWCIIRWEKDESVYADRWLLFIFLLLGLSVGVHLLNLLALPAIALVYYYKKYTPSTKGVIITLILSSLLMAFIIFGLIPGVVSFTAYFDRVFVNGMGLPVYTGAITFLLLLTLGTAYGIIRFRRQGKIAAHFVAVAFALWLTGYSTFSILIIRSNEQPYIDINNVENIYGLVDYLNREQYPKRPLFYGNNFNSPLVDINQRYTYQLYDGEYQKDLLIPEYIFDENTLTFFPRMASHSNPQHEQLYHKWVDIKGRPVSVTGYDGTRKTIQVPTFGDNLSFFFKYQLGYMYGRYFMWNFVGRQNNIQGLGHNIHGNWQSGIPFIDNNRIVPEEILPADLANNEASNKYYFLPLILGLIGLVYQYKTDKNNTLITVLFFILTGAAIVFYLNEIPRTPRERDYAFVGSFYVFAIWIGLGALRLLTLVRNARYKKAYAIAAFVLIGLAVPANMLEQNYDDHDRSERYTTRAHAKNLLTSCNENAIFFTAADNDSYPVWYIQEVEKYRTDVLPILKTFLPTGWYIKQLYTNFARRGALDITVRSEDFFMGKNMSVEVVEKRKRAASASQVIEYVRSDNKNTKIAYRDGSQRNYIPVKNVFIPVDKKNLKETLADYQIEENAIPDTLNFRLKAKSLSADELIILDIIANNDWKRPIYFLDESMADGLGLRQYVHREGLVYRLLPFKRSDKAFSNAEHQYNLIMNKFNWGNVSSDIYLDWTHVRMFYTFGYREMAADVAKDLVKIGENQKAIELLDLITNTISADKVASGYRAHELVGAYYAAGATEKAENLAEEMYSRLDTWFVMFEKLPVDQKQEAQEEVYGKMYMLRELINATDNRNPELTQKMHQRFGEMNAAITGRV